MPTGHLSTLFRGLLIACVLTPLAVHAADEPIYPAPAQEASAGSKGFDLDLISGGAAGRPIIMGAFERAEASADGKPAFLVKQQQVGFKIDEPAFVGPATRIAWRWKKEAGKVCIVQIDLLNLATQQTRHFGYGAGVMSESPS